MTAPLTAPPSKSARWRPRTKHVKPLIFARNFGHQIAVTAGLDYASGDAVMIIDADLQDPPEVIAELAAKWREGYEVVYAVRHEREGESLVQALHRLAVLPRHLPHHRRARSPWTRAISA